MKALTGVLLLCVASQALADSGKEAAKAHFDRGMISYNLQDWASAIQELRAAYAADPLPNYLFTIGQAQRLSGDCEAAILTYRSFVRTASAAGRAAGEGLIRQCEATLERKRVEAGQQKLDEQKALEEARRTQATKAAVTAPVVVTAPAVNTLWYADPLGDVLAVLGLGAVGTGAALLVISNGNVTRAQTAPSYADYTRQVGAAQPLQTAGVAAIAGGSAFLVSAVIRYAVVGARAPAKPTVALLVDDRGAVLTLSGQF